MRNIIRSIKYHKWTSLINIFGFAVGLAAAMLLVIFISHELSYDQHWENGERIYRMYVTNIENNNVVRYPISLRKAYTELPARVPGIESAVQIYRTRDAELKYDNQRFRNLKFFYVDSTFFKVFQMQAVAGDIKNSLRDPNSIVINQSTANILFGQNDPVGKLVSVSEYLLKGKRKQVKIGAVIPDLPKTSHFEFDVLLPMESNRAVSLMSGLEYYTYYTLRNNSNPSATINTIKKVHSSIMQSWADNIGLEKTPGTELLPIDKIYLHSQARGEIGKTGDPQTIKIFTFLTVLILIIAIANFINLFLVQSKKRAMQVGIRKTLGATQLQLIGRFLLEAFLLSTLAFILAIYAVSIMVGPFGELVRRPLSIAILMAPHFLAIILGLFITVTVLASAYPAWYLSHQQPVQVLKGTNTQGSPKKRLRKSIVLLQFAISMLLLTNLIVIERQVDYMHSKPLGFDTKNVVAYQNLSPRISNSFSLIKNELLQYPAIKSVTGSHSRPGKGASGQSLKKQGLPKNSRISVREVRIQPDYLNTYSMELAVGREFDSSRPTDRKGIILNQAAVQALQLEEPIGAPVVMFSDPMHVVGVVKDYHYSSLRVPIKPEVFTYYKDEIFFISIRLNTTNPQRTITNINKIFRKYDPEYIPDYSFLHDVFTSMYGSERRLMLLVRAGSILALILTILGLAAITAITVQQRTKEIGIRKAIGASNWEIVKLFVNSQLIPLIITISISSLLSLEIIRRWLQNYAYQIDISIWFFTISGLFVFLIALGVTATISYRASRANPIESLRYE